MYLFSQIRDRAHVSHVRLSPVIMSKEKMGEEEAQTRQAGEVDEGVTGEIGGEYDAVFGEITEDGPNYRNVCATISMSGLSRDEIMNDFR